MLADVSRNKVFFSIYLHRDMLTDTKKKEIYVQNITLNKVTQKRLQ